MGLRIEEGLKSAARVTLSHSEPSQWLKISQKVALNSASEASYVYILSRQKLIKNAPKNGQFWRVFENLVLLDRSFLVGQNLVENA